MTNKLRSNETGVAAIEFALILPVLTLMLIALWDLSHFSSEKMRLEQMTRAIASNVISELDKTSFGTLTNTVVDQFYPDANEPKPDVQISDGCYCASVAFGCYGLCASGVVPDRIVTIHSSILVNAPLLGDRNADTTLDIKIR